LDQNGGGWQHTEEGAGVVIKEKRPAGRNRFNVGEKRKKILAAPDRTPNQKTPKKKRKKKKKEKKKKKKLSGAKQEGI